MGSNIVDIRFGTIRHGNNGYQHCFRIYFDDAPRSPWYRLKHNKKPLLITSVDIKNKWDEPPHIQSIIDVEVNQKIKQLSKSGGMATTGSEFRTVGKAMEAFFTEYERTHRTDVRRNAKSFLHAFGECPLDALTHQNILEFAYELQQNGLALDTTRLYLAAGSQMVSMLKRRRIWREDNPFFGVLKGIEKGFPMPLDEISVITDEEYATMLQIAEDLEYKAAKHFITISRFTGLRVTEVLNLELARLDRANQIWDVKVTKTKSREFYRKIYVPSCLIAFVANEGELYFKGYRRQFDEVIKRAGVNIKQKTFRKDFARRMELAGASTNAMNAHQGRGRNQVIYIHYIRDKMQAVSLAKEYIDRMFYDASNRALVLIK